MTLLNYLVVHIFMLQLEFMWALYCGVLSQKTCLASKKVLKITALSALVSSIVVSFSHDFVTIVRNRENEFKWLSILFEINFFHMFIFSC